MELSKSRARPIFNLLVPIESTVAKMSSMLVHLRSNRLRISVIFLYASAVCLVVYLRGALRADSHLVMQIFRALMKWWTIAGLSSWADLTRSLMLEACVGISNGCVYGWNGFVAHLNRSVFLNFPHIKRSLTGRYLQATWENTRTYLVQRCETPWVQS